MALFHVFHGPSASCFHLSGDDASRYLQNQMTVNIPEPEKHAWTYGLWLNQNGRVLADSFVYAQAEDSCLVWSYDCPAKILGKTISRNIVADDVEVQDLREELSFTMLAGPECLPIAEHIGYPVPESTNVSETEDCFQYRCLLAGAPALVFIGPKPFHNRLHASLKRSFPELDALPFDHEMRHCLRAEAGIPAIPQDIGERNLPQEGHYEEHAIDFGKGCFPGQEIMASFRKSGRLSKALFRFRIAMGTIPSSTPVEIYAGKLAVGTLTTLASDGVNRFGLGLLRLRAADRRLYIKGQDEQEIPIHIMSPTR